MVVATIWRGWSTETRPEKQEIFEVGVWDERVGLGESHRLIEKRHYCTMYEARQGHRLLVEKHGGEWKPPTNEEVRVLYAGL